MIVVSLGFSNWQVCHCCEEKVRLRCDIVTSSAVIALLSICLDFSFALLFSVLHHSISLPLLTDCGWAAFLLCSLTKPPRLTRHLPFILRITSHHGSL